MLKLLKLKIRLLKLMKKKRLKIPNKPSKMKKKLIVTLKKLTIT